MYLNNSCRALEESDALSKNFKQPLPETITSEELFGFNMRDEFELLRVNSPVLFSVVTGAMGLGGKESEVKFD